MNTVSLAQKDEEPFYLSLLKDAYFAAIFQGYQPGIQVLSADLEKHLGPTGSPLDSLHAIQALSCHIRLHTSPETHQVKCFQFA